MRKKNVYNPEKLRYEKKSDRSFNLLVLFCLVAVSVIIGLVHQSFRKQKFKMAVENTKITLVDTTIVDTTFSEVELVKALDLMHIRFPHIVFAQYIEETGRGTSPIYIENHNIVGMKPAYYRPTTCIGKNRGHAVFRDWKSCIADYALWQTFTRCLKLEDDEDYYDHLVRCGYAESPTYIQHLKQNVSKYYEIKEKLK